MGSGPSGCYEKYNANLWYISTASNMMIESCIELGLEFLDKAVAPQGWVWVKGQKYEQQVCTVLQN